MKKYFLFFFYLTVSLFVGKEFHPFSRYPMYDSFPNYAYSFYVADNQNMLMPFVKNFTVEANEVSHQYCEIMDEHKFDRGGGVETDSALTIVGRELLHQILLGKKQKISADSVSLHRVYYLFEAEKITKHDKELYKSKVE